MTRPGPPNARINGVIHAYDSWGALRTRCGMRFEWLGDLAFPVQRARPKHEVKPAEAVDAKDVDCMACMSLGGLK